MTENTDRREQLVDALLADYRAKRAKKEATSPTPPVEIRNVLAIDDVRIYLFARYIVRLIAVGQLRKVLARFGVQVTRREAYGLLFAARFILSDVIPDYRGLPKSTTDKASEGLIKLIARRMPLPTESSER